MARELGASTPIMPVTNAIESVHMRLPKIIKTREHFPTDEAATKLIWLSLYATSPPIGHVQHDNGRTP